MARAEILAEIGRSVRVATLSTGRSPHIGDREVLRDPELILVLAPLRYRFRLEDAVYEGRERKHHVPLTERLELLALFVEERHLLRGEPPWDDLPLHRIEFSGGAGRKALVDALFDAKRREAFGIGRLGLYAFSTTEWVHFGLEDRT